MKVEFRSCPAWGSMRTLAAAFAVPLLVGMAPGVQAAESTTEDEGSNKITLEQVTVTAERREENWKDVPIAVSTLSGKEVETLGIRDIRQLSDYVPGLTVRSFNVQTPEISIRGIGSQTLTHITDDLSVGFFLDDVYLARGAGQKAELNDLERVEVLKGPQGTLFGRNTIGGAVVVTTKKPTNELAGEATVSLGNYNLVEGQGVFNVPLVQDRLLARFAVDFENHNGYQKNVFDETRFDQQVAIDPRITKAGLNMGHDGNEADDLAWRFKLRGIITDNWEALLTVDSERRRPGGLLTGQFVREPTSFQWQTQAPPSALLPYADALYVGLGSIAPVRFQERPYSPAVTPPADLRTSFYGQVGTDSIDHDGISLHTTANFSNASLIFIASKRHLKSNTQEDLDASYGDYAYRNDHEWSNTNSQELRLESNDAGAWSLGGKLHWSSGLYRFEEKADKTLDGYAALTRGDAYGEQHVQTKSLGIFSQLTYKLTNRLALTAGYRWTDEDKTGLLSQYGRIAINFGDPVTYLGADQCVAAVVANPALLGLTSINLAQVINGQTVNAWLRGSGGRCGGVSGIPYLGLGVKSSDSRGTAKVALDYAVSDDTNAYFNFSQGFKSTAFNGGASNPTDASTVYAPETLNLYEVGMKIQDKGGKFRGSAAMFYNDYKDFKQPKFSFDSADPNRGITAGKGDSAEIYGFEIEVNFVLLDNVLITAATNRLAARIQHYSALDGTRLSTLDIVRVPSAQHHLSAQYLFPEAPFGQFTLRTDLVAEGPSINSVPISDTSQLAGRVSPVYITGNGGDRVLAWHKWDAQLDFESSTRKWDGSLWVRNLTNALYYTRSSVNFVDPEAVINAFWSDPRTFGITMHYKF